jgi:hypothetical protein
LVDVVPLLVALALQHLAQLFIASSPPPSPESIVELV